MPDLKYFTGFGNEFATEAVPGGLPVGQNAPQKAPLGLYTEQLSGSPFTAPRLLNRRTWTYRIRPSVMHKPYERIANGLANSRDFFTPHAAYDDRDNATFQVVAKFQGNLWATDFDHSPLDVVAWHGNYTPYKYDMARFNCINTVSFDHPDPSIYTVLTAPSGLPGTANVDFAIFPPRWLVAEHTFRPPWFHRNMMNEFMGFILGQYDAKAEGFLPGGASLHNCMSGHGPDAETFERASHAELKPQFIGDTLAFMFETRLPVRPTRFALESKILQHEYFECWQNLKKNFRPPQQ